MLMEPYYGFIRDIQQDPPTNYCAYCGGEIYSPWEDTFFWKGDPVCRDCLERGRDEMRLREEYEEEASNES